MWRSDIEQGPIRPPSEASSLLLRVSRNCPWNKCAFCSVYKRARFSLRSAEALIAEIDALAAAGTPAPRTVFLQDADPLVTPTEDLARILRHLRATFPSVQRVTTYARSRTLARRPLADLVRLKEAGLDRVHVGMESGCDAVLTLIRKGTTGAEQIEGGQKAKAAGFELSEYVMPGLGGRAHSAAHAVDTARVLSAIGPDFVRLRSTAVIARSPLAELEAAGEFAALGELEMVAEIRQMLAAAPDLTTRLESDHSLNLLMELRGDLPADREALIGLCDAVLALEPADQRRFVLARRLGWQVGAADLARPAVVAELDRVWAQVAQAELDDEAVYAQLRRRMV